MRNLSRYPIIGYGSGVVGVDELNAKVDDVWHGVLADSRAREEAGRILGIAPDDLERKFPTSPFEVRTNEAGLGPVETAILVFVGAVAYDLVKGVAKSAVKETLRILWQKVVKPQVENYLPLGAFGSEAYLDEPGDKKGIEVMVSGPLAPRQLDIGRKASLRILMTKAMIFRSEGLPGQDQGATVQQKAALDLIKSGATTARAGTEPPLGKLVRSSLCGFNTFTFKGHTTAADVLSRRIRNFRQEIDSFECQPCSNGKGEEKCLAEFLEFLRHTRRVVTDKYQMVTGDEAISWPKVLLETAEHHAHQTTDILDIAAATGTCRYADADNPISLVGLGIKDDAFSWATMCQLPYVLMHELLCHAFQGLKDWDDRCPVDSTCAWSEGWMDSLAFELTKQWLEVNDGKLPPWDQEERRTKMPHWVQEERRAIEGEASNLHDRRQQPQSSIQPHVLKARIHARHAAGKLELAYQGKNRLREPANYRLWRFSLRLNLHKVPQSKRNHIVEYLGLALEMCQGSRLDEIIAACERFIEHDDWKVLLNDLKTLTTAVQNVLQ